MISFYINWHFELLKIQTLRHNLLSKEKVSTLEDLKSLGINISIDDFGIGYSSYLNLKKLPIDKIKIAKDFVKGLNKNMEDDVIVDSIIFMSKNLKLEIIAEGVETQEQLDYLTSKKCDLIQGYYYYKPIPDSEITQILGIE